MTLRASATPSPPIHRIASLPVGRSPLPKIAHPQTTRSPPAVSPALHRATQCALTHCQHRRPIPTSTGNCYPVHCTCSCPAARRLPGPPSGFLPPPPAPSPSLSVLLDYTLLLTFPNSSIPSSHSNQRRFAHPNSNPFHAHNRAIFSFRGLQKPLSPITQPHNTFHDQDTTASNDQLHDRVYRCHPLKPTGARASEELGVERNIPRSRERETERKVKSQAIFNYR